MSGAVWVDEAATGVPDPVRFADGDRQRCLDHGPDPNGPSVLSSRGGGAGGGTMAGSRVVARCATTTGWWPTSAVTDWRATNLLSSRTWPRLGYRPSFLRLHRHLGY